MTPHDIIGIQLAENIHSQPPKERQAIAIVEAYRYGMQAGQWQNKKEFLTAAGGKFSKNALDAALNFAELPTGIRDFILAGTLPYAAGIELGGSVGTIRDWATMRAGMDSIQEGSEDESVVQEIVDTKLMQLVTTIQNRKLNGPAAVKLIAGQRNAYKEQIELTKDDAPTLELVMVSPADQLRSIRDEVRKEYGAELAHLASGPISSIERALQLHAAHGADMLPPNAIEVLTDRVTNYVRSVGSSALQLEF